MSPANPLSRLSAIIRSPMMTHSTESDWFLPYDGPVEPPPPPIRHPFAAAEIAQPRPIPATRSRATSKSDVRSRSRSRSVDTKRRSQRSFSTLEKGGVGGYPAPDKASVHSDHTFGHHRARSSTSAKQTEAIVFANHPFRMHTASPPPRTHSTPLTTPWVRTITASPAPPDPAPMRKRTMTYQPGLVTAFGSSTETRVGYRESGAFVDLDEREKERIRPTLLPSSLSLVGKSDQSADEHGRKDRYPGLGQYDMRSHPYALQSAPVRETRFGSASTTGTNTTGGSGKPLVPRKLKSSLKASMSTPELRIRIPSTVPPSGLSAGQTPTELPQVGIGARPRHPASSVAPSTTLEARSICDALIFARPRFRVASHEITPHDDEKRASVRVGETGFKGLVCFPRKASRDFKDKGKGKEKERQFQTLEQVVQEGEQLEKEREEWNAIGQASLFNTRARSLSRAQNRIGNVPRGQRSVSVSDGSKVWGTIKLKRSVEMLAANAFSQGHGPPSVTTSKRPGHAAQASVSTTSHARHATQTSVSTTSHGRHASGSVASRGHSRNGSWGQRVVCGSRSGSSLGEETPGNAHSSEGLVPKRIPVDNYPVVDIRPAPTHTQTRRAPPSVGFSFGTRLVQPQPQPSPDSDSVIGLAVSSPSGTSTPLVLPNHPFAQRAGAYPTDPAPPPPPGPERHRHPPRSSGSTERARLDDPKFAPNPSKPTLPLKLDHPFIARANTHVGEVRTSTHSGEVQRMFESAMLKSAGGQGELAFNRRRGSGDSGLGSSVYEQPAPMRGSAFGPPAGLEAMLERPAPIPESQSQSSIAKTGSVQAPGAVGGLSPVSGAGGLSPASGAGGLSPASGVSGLSPVSGVESLSRVSGMESLSHSSAMGSLSPASRAMTRTSSGLIDPSLMSPQSRSHESSSSSFSSPRPLNSIDDIESLRDIFYRPSPDRRSGSPPNEPVLTEEDEEEEEEEDEQPNEDWTFGRRPFELGPESHLIWRRREDEDEDSPLRISLAPGTPPSGVPESVHDSDNQSTSSQYVSTENVTFGVVPSARMGSLSVNVVSPRQSAALSLIDMYDYEPSTPHNFHSLPSPPGSLPTERPRESYYTSSSSVRPGMDHLISGFPTPPMDAATPLSASVLSSYFAVDTHTSSRRETD